MNSNLKGSITAKEKSHFYLDKYEDQILAALDDIANSESYRLERYLGVTAKGVLIEVVDEGQEYVGKLIIDDNDKFPQCSKESEQATLFASGVKYVQEILSSRSRTIKFKGANFSYCFMTYEVHDTSVNNGGLIPQTFYTTSKQNSKIIFRFFARLIYGFAMLNFQGHVLHGNVNGDNILVRYDAKNKEIYPIISDFSLMLRNEIHEDIADPIKRYDVDAYRCPELNNARYETISNKLGYRYSGKMLEDVFAIGVLIDQVLIFKTKFVDLNTCEGKLLILMAQSMMHPLPIKHLINDKDRIKMPAELKRTSILSSLRATIMKIQECVNADGDPVNAQFIRDGKALLRELGVEMQII